MKKMIFGVVAVLLILSAGYVIVKNRPANNSETSSALVILKQANIYFSDQKITEDVVVNRQKSEMTIRGKAISFSSLEDVVDDMLSAQKRGGSQSYIFIGGDSRKSESEIVKIGHCPKGEDPPNF